MFFLPINKMIIKSMGKTTTGSIKGRVRIRFIIIYHEFCIDIGQDRVGEYDLYYNNYCITEKRWAEKALPIHKL